MEKVINVSFRLSRIKTILIKTTGVLNKTACWGTDHCGSWWMILGKKLLRHWRVTCKKLIVGKKVDCVLYHNLEINCKLRALFQKCWLGY